MEDDLYLDFDSDGYDGINSFELFTLLLSKRLLLRKAHTNKQNIEYLLTRIGDENRRIKMIIARQHIHTLLTRIQDNVST